MRSWARSGSERRTRVSRSMRCTKANSPVCVVEYRVVRIGLFQALWQGGSGPQLGSARKFARARVSWAEDEVAIAIRRRMTARMTSVRDCLR